jgi:hypothetical protein
VKPPAILTKIVLGLRNSVGHRIPLQRQARSSESQQRLQKPQKTSYKRLRTISLNTVERKFNRVSALGISGLTEGGKFDQASADWAKEFSCKKDTLSLNDDEWKIFDMEKKSLFRWGVRISQAPE